MCDRDFYIGATARGDLTLQTGVCESVFYRVLFYWLAKAMEHVGNSHRSTNSFTQRHFNSILCQ